MVTLERLPHPSSRCDSAVSEYELFDQFFSADSVGGCMFKDLLSRPCTWAARLGRRGVGAITELEVVRVEGYHLAEKYSVIQGRFSEC